MRSPVQVWSAAPLKNTTLVVFFNLCKVFCTHLCDLFQKSHVEPVVCARRLRILRALIAFSCRLKYPAKLHAATACRFLCASRTPLQKLCRRVRRLRSRLPLASNFSLFTCRQQLILSAFIDVNFGESVVCFFQLADIVDFLLIHRPYDFIVQFLMINTGNGGSFVQL